jgi:hypothetical protein
VKIIRWPVRVVTKAWRRRQLSQLLDDLQAWEADGRDLLAQIVELSDPGDDLYWECERILNLLTGP